MFGCGEGYCGDVESLGGTLHGQNLSKGSYGYVQVDVGLASY